MSNEIQQFTGTALQVKNDFVDPIKNAITGALPLFMREDSEAWIRGAILEVSKTPALVQFAKNNFPAFTGTLTRVAAAKKASRGSSSPSSPWVQHEVAMWRKTAIHELANFVDSSVEECRPERLEAMKARAALALEVEREKTSRMEAENRALELKIKLMEMEATEKEEA